MEKNLNKLSFEELKKQVEILEKQKKTATTKTSGVYVIGEPYLIRTVTMIYTGKLINTTDKELVITEACWIPETERWADTCKNGNFKEVEPYPTDAEVIINREAVLDLFKVDFKLPTIQK